MPAENTVRVEPNHPAPKPCGGERTDVPVPAHRRPLLDDRRLGSLGCLLGGASLAIDQAASDGTVALNPLAGRNTLVVPVRNTCGALLERREPVGAGCRVGDTHIMICVWRLASTGCD